MGSGAGMTDGGYLMMTAPNGMYIYMGHFSELNVYVGQKLKKGQHIGKDMFVNAYHIHLEYSNANAAGNGVNDMDPKDIIPYKYVNDWYAEIEM
jgi:murein DD-endopeptidase MepM/ murein hydrolase activator NlpD